MAFRRPLFSGQVGCALFAPGSVAIRHSRRAQLIGENSGSNLHGSLP
jgi:hypothetical protein